MSAPRARPRPSAPPPGHPAALRRPRAQQERLAGTPARRDSASTASAPPVDGQSALGERRVDRRPARSSDPPPDDRDREQLELRGPGSTSVGCAAATSRRFQRAPTSSSATADDEAQRCRAPVVNSVSERVEAEHHPEQDADHRQRQHQPRRGDRACKRDLRLALCIGERPQRGSELAECGRERRSGRGRDPPRRGDAAPREFSNGCQSRRRQGPGTSRGSTIAVRR